MVRQNSIIRQKRGGGRWGPYDPEMCARMNAHFWDKWEIKDSDTGQIWKTSQDYEAFKAKAQAEVKAKAKPKAKVAIKTAAVLKDK